MTGRAQSIAPNQNGAAEAESPSPSRSFTRWVAQHEGFAAFTLALFAAVLAWFRLDPLTPATVWAEDGPLFFADRLPTGPLVEWFTPYAGYLHVVPRMIADVAFLFPLETYAYAMSISTILVLGAVVGLSFVQVRELLPWLPARITLSLVPVLAPVVATEVLGNAANLHWLFLWLGPFVLLGRARSRTGAWLLAIVALLMTLSEPLLAVFSPLILFRLKDRSAWPVFAGYFVGLAAQLATTIRVPRGIVGDGSAGIRSTLLGYAVNVTPATLTGDDSIIRRALLDVGVILPITLTAVLFMIAAWTVWRGDRLQRITVITLVLASLIIWTAAYLVNAGSISYSSFGPAEWATFSLNRYSVATSMFLISVFPVTAQVLWHRKAHAVGIAAIAVMALVAVMAYIPSYTMRESGPAWAPQIEQARVWCETHDPAAKVEVQGAPSGWHVGVPCADLARP